VRNLSKKAPSHWIIAGTLLVAGSCAPLSQAAVGSADPDITSPKAQRVFEFGFEAIKERYLTGVPVGIAAFEGMRGLATIDPAISFERVANQRMAARYNGEQVAEYPTPANDDPDGWAAFVVLVSRDLAPLSPALRQANNEKIYEVVFDATLAKLDPFSRYAGATEAREHRAARNGFGGIGVRYDLTPQDLVLTEVMPETPAAEAHLQIGDHVLAIDGNSVAGLDQKAVSDRMRGPIASEISLSVKHDPAQQTTTVNLHRGLIVPPTVSMSLQDGIATIAISSFNHNTASAVAEDVIKAKAAPGFKGVVLDLRGNPGGLLDQGVEVADLFMDHGRIVSTRGRHPASVQIYDAKSGDPGEDVPLVVMVDGGSASAAEIVTAALQDSGRAIVVGTNSYGKGTVQTVLRMPNDGEMTLTWSRFYSPSGYALHGLGVLPTVCTADTHAQAAALLAPVRAEHPAVAADIATWRTSSIDDLKQRTKLRSVCPAAKQGDAKVDLELARDLIKDRQLYGHALALTTPAVTTTTAATTPPPGNAAASVPPGEH
jgi:carboxyl-terminal processing protease